MWVHGIRPHGGLRYIPFDRFNSWIYQTSNIKIDRFNSWTYQTLNIKTETSNNIETYYMNIGNTMVLPNIEN